MEEEKKNSSRSTSQSHPSQHGTGRDNGIGTGRGRDKKLWVPPKMEIENIYEMRALQCAKCESAATSIFTPSCLFAPPGS